MVALTMTTRTQAVALSATGGRAGKAKRGRPAGGEIEQRKVQILACAKAAFIARGYSDVSLAAIAAEAGVTKRTIYQHLGDKEALFRAVFFEGLQDAMRIDLTLDRLPVGDALMSLARQLIEHALADDVIALDRAMVMARARFPRFVSDLISEGMRISNSTIAETFDRMIEAGLLPPNNTSRTADLFYDVVVGNRGNRMAKGHDEQMPDDEELSERVSLFLYGRFASVSPAPIVVPDASR